MKRFTSYLKSKETGVK